MRACAVIPAYQSELTVADVIASLQAELGSAVGVLLVVDDGSTDRTAEVAAAAGVRVVRHPANRGKGAALRTGFAEARAMGYDAVLAVDADGQHPAHSARLVLEADPDPGALVLGIRDLVRAGAPRANRFSNGISNFFLSRFAGEPLADTQCGLRRYPVEAMLQIHAFADGYAFEAEVILKALAAGVRLVEVPVDVIYPVKRTTHFNPVKDPARIIATVLATVAEDRWLMRRTGARSVQPGDEP